MHRMWVAALKTWTFRPFGSAKQGWLVWFGRSGNFVVGRSSGEV